jgi:hypothetical protein
LAAGKFGVVVLYRDLFSGEGPEPDLEVPSLPESHLEEVRRHYRLWRHIPGPLLNGAYVYLPLDLPLGAGRTLPSAAP